MKINAKNKIVDISIVIGVTLVFALLVGIVFSYYHDLNDDSLMKSILSGSYTGKPHGQNVQFYYPLGAALAFLYSLFPKLPIFGLFLLLCQWIAPMMISYCFIRKTQKLWLKLAVSFLVNSLILGIMLQHFVFIQYSVTSSILVGTAILYFYTNQISWKTSMVLIALLSIAVCIREEIVFLTLPLVALVGCIKWSQEKQIFSVHNRKKYLGLFAGILGGILLCFLADTWYLSQDSWAEFMDFYEARTQVYDYRYIPSYAEHEKFYQEIGLEAIDVTSLENYNYGINVKINTEVLREIAEYVDRIDTRTSIDKLHEIRGEYTYRLYAMPWMPGNEAPWNLLILGSYVLLGLCYVFKKGQRRQLIGVALYFLLRTLLLGYIMWQGREPIRILHSLYFVELCGLWAMLTSQINWKKYGKYKIMGLFLLALTLLSYQVANVWEIKTQRDAQNEAFLALYDYVEENEKSFFFLDVYSTVSYSEPLFSGQGVELENFDLIGGWIHSSPLQEEKLEQFQIENIANALSNLEHVYYIQKSEGDIAWLSEYYLSIGIEIAVELVEEIAGGFSVYQLQESCN